MSAVPWRSPLAEALQNNSSLPHIRYLQLATVRPNGRPANRTVVFRGFLEETNQLKFVTDSRSEKIEQIHHSPWGEICWYFPLTREQFRLAGGLTLVTDREVDPRLDRARQMAWRDLSDAARSQFAWPHPRHDRAIAFEPSLPSPIEPLSTFCLLLLEPESVERLDLYGDPHNRWIYDRDRSLSWSSRFVNP